MKVTPISSTHRFQDRRTRSKDRRAWKRSNAGQNSDRRAKHATISHIWLNSAFAAQLLAQRAIDADQIGQANKLRAGKAYDKVLNPYLRPLHSRKA